MLDIDGCFIPAIWLAQSFFSFPLCFLLIVVIAHMFITILWEISTTPRLFPSLEKSLKTWQQGVILVPPWSCQGSPF